MVASYAIAVLLAIIGLGGLISFFNLYIFPSSHKIRGFFKFLRSRYGVSISDKRPGPATTVKDSIEGNSIFASITAMPMRVAAYARLVITGDGFLPEPLQIQKRARLYFPSLTGPEGEKIVLSDKDLIGLSVGSRHKTCELVEILRTLKTGSMALLIHRQAIAIMVRLHNTRFSTVKRTVAAAVYAASLLKEIGRETDLSLPVLTHLAHASPSAFEMKRALYILLARYRDSPLTREMLSVLMKGPDFEAGLKAAVELGIEPLHYCRFCVEALPQADAAKAIPVFLRHSIPGAEAYLIERFHRTEELPVKRSIIMALAERPSEAAGPLYLEALDEKNPYLLSAAVATLSEHGGADALAPLYALAKDENQSERLRDAAGSALAAIHARLGDLSDGRLSLAGDAAGEGGLSKVEDGESDSSE